MVISRKLGHVEKRGKTRGRSTKHLEASECNNSEDRRNHISRKMVETSQIISMSLETSKQERTYLSFDYQYETTFIHSDPKDDTSRRPCEYQRQLKNQHRCSFSGDSSTWKTRTEQTRARSTKHLEAS